MCVIEYMKFGEPCHDRIMSKFTLLWVSTLQWKHAVSNQTHTHPNTLIKSIHNVCFEIKMNIYMLVLSFGKL